MASAIKYDPDYALAHHARAFAYLVLKNNKALALAEYKILLPLNKVMASDLFKAIYC